MRSVRFGKKPGNEEPRPAADLGRPGEAMRRAVNVAVALIGVALAAPLMIVIALILLLLPRAYHLCPDARGCGQKERQGPQGPFAQPLE
ncbi:MAG: hypothetical protein P8X82_12730 [Gemmatimonadales bacterium]